MLRQINVNCGAGAVGHKGRTLGRQSKQHPNQCKGQVGVAVLEALIGLLVFSVGILAVIGLQANSIRNTTEARSRIEAQGFSNQILGQMWVDRGNLASYAGSAVIAELPGGVREITVNGNQVTITVTWQQAGATRRYTTTTWIEGAS